MDVSYGLLVPAIERLPSEALSRISECGYKSPALKGHIPFPVIVSHVSQRWRTVAHGNSVL